MYEVRLINDDQTTYINVSSTELGAPRVMGTIKKGINTINSFEFEIYPNNPGYGAIHHLKTKVEVHNILTNKLEFIGRVLTTSPKQTSSGNVYMNVVCECELGYLMDSSVMYEEFHDLSVTEYLEKLVNNHNSQVGADKHFRVGNVTITGNLYRFWNYTNSFDTLKDDLLDKLGGELSVRYDGDIRYLDYTFEPSDVKETEIRLSKNLISIEQEKDPTQVISRLIPLGCKLNDETEERLTISDVNQGCYYVDDVSAIKEFGVICRTETWDDVTLPENLLRKAMEFQKENNKVKKAHKITAIDLSLIGIDMDSFEVGNYYPVINPLMGINEPLRVIEKTIRIENPEESSIVVGDKFSDIKDFQLQMDKAASIANKTKTDLNQTVVIVGQVNEELSNTVSVVNETVGIVQTTNEAVTALNEMVQSLSRMVNSNLEKISELTTSTENIAQSVDDIEEKIERMNKRMTLGV